MHRAPILGAHPDADLRREFNFHTAALNTGVAALRALRPYHDPRLRHAFQNQRVGHSFTSIAGQREVLLRRRRRRRRCVSKHHDGLPWYGPCGSCSI